MSKSSSVTVSDHRSFQLSINFTKLPDLTPNKSKSIVNFKIQHQPLFKIEQKQQQPTANEQHVIFIFDVSGSMHVRDCDPETFAEIIRENDGIKLGIEALNKLVEIFSKNQQTKTFLSGITFSDDAQVFLNKRELSSSDPEIKKLQKEITEEKSFHKGGGTNIPEAFFAIQPEWMQTQAVKIYFVTDGKSKVDHEMILNYLAVSADIELSRLKSKCTIYALGIGPEADEKTLQPFVLQTNGEYFWMKQNQDIPRYLETLASSTASFIAQVYVKRVMLKKGNHLIQFMDLEEIKGGDDKQAMGFSIPNEWFADPSLAIHLVLSNDEVIIYEGLAHLSENPIQDMFEFVVYYGQAVEDISKNKSLSVTQKLSQLGVIKSNIEKLLTDPQSKKCKFEFETICQAIDTFSNEISSVSYSQKYFEEEKLKLTAVTGRLACFAELSKLQNEYKSKPVRKISDKDKTQEFSCFSINDIQFKDFIREGKIIKPFAYMEQPPGSLKNSDEVYEFHKQRIITVINPADLEKLKREVLRLAPNNSAATSFENLISWAKMEFQPFQEEKDNLAVNSIINDKNKLYPRGKSPHILVEFSEFINRKIGTAAHRALTLALLTVAYQHKTDTDSVRIYQSFSKSGKIHTAVLKECKEQNNEQIWLGDPTYGIFENIKSPLGRLKAIETYKKLGLEDFLFELGVEKNWESDLTDVPMTPELLENEVNQAEPYDLTSPIGDLEFMEKPVYIYSPSQAKLDEKKGNVARPGMIGKYSYEKKDIQEYLSNNPKTDPFGNPLPNDIELKTDKEKAQTIWGFYLMIARSRPGLFLLKAAESVQSFNGPVAKDEAIARRQQIKFLKKENSSLLKKAPPKIYHISNNQNLAPNPLSPNPTNPLHENKYESKNESSFNLRIRLAGENLELDFVNQQQCQNFCNKITPSKIIREKDKEFKSNPPLNDQAATVPFVQGNTKLIFPLRKIGPNLCCVFEKLPTVMQMLSVLRIPVEENEIEISIQGSIAIRSGLKSEGVLMIPEMSHLLQKDAYLEVSNHEVIKSKLDPQPNDSIAKNTQAMFGSHPAGKSLESSQLSNNSNGPS